MLRLIFALAVAVPALAYGSIPVAAQSAPVWVRGYPQTAASGCVEFVAVWSDGSFTSVPWTCPAGTIPVRPDSTATAVRSYPQQAANGCVEYVVAWSDGIITLVPFSCPAGAIYVKPGSGGPVDVSTPPTAAPPVLPAQVQPSGLPYRAIGTTYDRHCGITQLKLYVQDAQGNPLNGIVARVEWDGIQGEPIKTNPTGKLGSYDPGWTDAILSGRGMIGNNWRVWIIDDAGNRLSETVPFQTNNDCESENAKQIVTVTYQLNTAPAPVPAGP